MEVAESVALLRTLTQPQRSRGESIGFVATMGALQAGHLMFAQEARRENDLVVMSIFVNPTQFAPGEDFERYPRDLTRDLEAAKTSGTVDILFLPTVKEIYPDGPEEQQVWVDPGPIGERLEGASRPGHFRGVATVVTKLFNMVQPSRTYFGQKDAQQAAIIRRMVGELAFPIEVRVIPTVREADMLALSSRNAYLTPGERAQAPALYEALRWAEGEVSKKHMSSAALEDAIRRRIEQGAPSSRMDYVAVVDPETFEPISGVAQPPALVALAAYFGHTRLIDNVLVDSR